MNEYGVDIYGPPAIDTTTRRGRRTAHLRQLEWAGGMPEGYLGDKPGTSPWLQMTEIGRAIARTRQRETDARLNRWLRATGQQNQELPQNPGGDEIGGGGGGMPSVSIGGGSSSSMESGGYAPATGGGYGDEETGQLMPENDYGLGPQYGIGPDDGGYLMDMISQQRKLGRPLTTLEKLELMSRAGR